MFFGIKVSKCRGILIYEYPSINCLYLRICRMIRNLRSRKFEAWLKKKHGLKVNCKRVQRLMQLMGIEAIFQRPKFRAPGAQHKIYPYLLGDVNVETPNQVWASEITYIPIRRGFMYLVAIMDWHSRFVLAWELSNTMEVTFCLEALQKALMLGTPQIFNSDQGSQFTSNAFTSSLSGHGIQISMDSKGRCFDNIFIVGNTRKVIHRNVLLRSIEGSRMAPLNHFSGQSLHPCFRLLAQKNCVSARAILLHLSRCHVAHVKTLAWIKSTAMGTFIERLWRTVKYEDIYIKDYQDVHSLVVGMRRFFDLYNFERLHQALGYQTPSEVYGI